MEEFPPDDPTPLPTLSPPPYPPPPPPPPPSPPPPTPTPAPLQRALGPQETGVHCIRCGHNLTGATIGGTCPECGEPIDPSLRVTATTTSGYAITSLVLGILSIPACFCYGVPGFLLGILAIIFSQVAARDIDAGRAHPSSRGLATAGLVCGLIGVSICVVFWFLVFIVNLS